MSKVSCNCVGCNQKRICNLCRYYCGGSHSQSHAAVVPEPTPTVVAKQPTVVPEPTQEVTAVAEATVVPEPTPVATEPVVEAPVATEPVAEGTQ